MSTDEVIRLLQEDNISEHDWVADLQRKLYLSNHAKYNKNYNYCKSCFEDGGDGDLGPNTRADLIAFLQDHPKALLDLGPKMTQHLYDQGYSRALQNIVKDNPSLQIDLRAEIDCMMEGRSLTDLSKDELKKVQTNWKLLGEYTGRIDGLNGPKTRDAYKYHTPAGCGTSAEEQTAPGQASSEATSYNVPNLTADFERTSSRKGVNGDFGIPLHHIQAAQEAALRGEVYTGYKPEPGQKVVVIDLGHGSRVDKGAHSKFTDQSETDFVDPVALELAEQYYRDGYFVAFTRNPEERIPLGADASLSYRARVAAGLGADIFISLHANGSTDNTASYGAVYYPSSGATENDKLFAHQLAQNMDIRGDNRTAKELAGNFQVLNEFRRIGKEGACCVLIEQGFLTNRGDSAALERISRNPSNFCRDLLGATNNYVSITDPSNTQYLANAKIPSNKANM